MRPIVVFGLVASLCLSEAAWSADFYVEGPALVDRADAVAMSRAASQDGHKARVERHQVDEDWQFTVRIDGFTDRDSAVKAATSLGDHLGVEMSVREGGEGESAGAVSAPRGEGVAPQDAASLIARAVGAHRATSEKVGEAGSLLFEYQRRLPDGEIIDHRWASRGDDRYVSLVVVAGDAVSSETRAVGEVGWLTVGEGQGTKSDRIHALEAIAHFEPAEIIPFILAFPSIAETRREIQLLEFDGESDLEGSATLMLRYDGDRATGPIALELDAKSYQVRRVIFEGGKLVHQFDDYKPLTKGLVVPARIRTWRDGQLADEVELRTLDPDPKLSDAWFSVPGSP